MAVQLNDGTWGPGAESMHWKLYDRHALANAQTNFTLFANKAGDTRQGVALNRADTNAWGAGSVPSNHKMTIWKVHFYYQAIETRTEAEFLQILAMFQETVIRFEIDGKDDMFRVPLWSFQSSFQAGVNNSVGGSITYPANGQAIYSGCWDLEIPIILQELTPYKIEGEHLTAPNSNLDGDFLGFILDGRLDRSN